jgi:hypothetical protein
MIKVTDEIREAALRLATERDARLDTADRKALTAIADDNRKLIDASWWKGVHGVVGRVKLDKLKAMADAKRNPNEHERSTAATKLAELEGRRPPGLRPKPPPLPRSAEEWEARRKQPKTGPASEPPARRKLPSSGSVAKLHPVSDSVATAVSSDSVAKAARPVSDSVAKLRALNAKRTAKRAAALTGLKCQTCGNPLSAAQRVTARFCGPTCRSKAFRAR